MTIATNKHLAVIRDYKRIKPMGLDVYLGFKWLFNDDNGLAYIGTVWATSPDQARAKAAHDLTMRQLRLSHELAGGRDDGR